MRIEDKTYSNAGNQAVVDLVDADSRRLLDVGCGDGANSRLLRKLRPDLRIEGITRSPEEAVLAGKTMEKCIVADIESNLPSDLIGGFDVILFSHVLEHLSYPEKVVAKMLDYLRPGGQIIIAVPNVASWRTRWRLMKGDFQYEEFGVFDATHLRFFTYKTAANYLLAQCGNLETIMTSCDGSVPLWPFRKILPTELTSFLDDFGCKHRPNLFGSQILVSARKVNG